MKLAYCKKHFSKQRSMVAVAALCILISSGLAMGEPSKRAVAPGEVVPQEDALMEAGVELPNAGENSTEGDIAQTISQESVEVNAAGAEVSVDQTESVVVQVQEIENESLSSGSNWHRLDAENRQYAAVKMVENGIWFKFAEGKSYLADGASTALNNISRLKQGENLIIVTYKDAGLSEVDNETLALTRAQNIKKALLGLKISSDRIVMLKPRVASGVPDFALFPDRVDLKVEAGSNYTEEEVFTE